MAGVTAVLAGAHPALGGGGGLDVSLTRILLALVTCIGVAIVAILLIRRSGGRIDPSLLGNLRPSRAVRRIEVIESRRISTHAEMCLLRCDGEDLLILSSATSVRLVRRTPATEPAA